MTNSIEDKQRGAEANREKAKVRDGLILQKISKGATHAELAEEYGVSVATVRTMVLRARRRAGIRIRPYVEES